MRFGFCCPLKLHYKNLSSKHMHRHRVLQKTHSLHLSSSDTAFVLSVLLFSARYVNIVYLLDPQQLACTPIKLETLINLQYAWASCVALPMLTVPTHTGAMEYEYRIWFILTHKAVFLMFFENDVAEFSDCDSHPNKHRYCIQFAE